MNPCSSNSSQSLMANNQGGVFRHHVSWSPPVDNSWKLNFAGLVSDHVAEKGGAAFIIRDEDAVFKHGFATPVSDVNNNVVLPELVALSNGLEMAMNLGVDYLEIEGNGFVVLHLLHDLAPVGPGAIRELYDGCTELLRGFKSVRVSLVDRFNNQAANRLAMMMNQEEDPHFWPGTAPCAISGILLEDVIGRWVKVADA